MVKAEYKCLLLICIVILITGCASAEDSPRGPDNAPVSTGAPEKAVYQKITAAQAKAKMEEGQPYILLDVRTLEEFTERRIAGAVLIPDFDIKNRAAAELPDKEALILVYCRTGGRSAKAARELTGLGYANVYDMGGIADWPYGTTGR